MPGTEFLVPCYDRIVVRRKEAPTKVGIIELPAQAQVRPWQGEVLAVGLGRVNQLSPTGRDPMPCKVGDTILYSMYGGTGVEVNREELVIVKAEEVLAVIKTRDDYADAPDIGVESGSADSSGTESSPVAAGTE